MRKFWDQLSLSYRIVLPFLVVCLSLFLLGVVALGYWFTDTLEQNFQKEVITFAERAKQDFAVEMQNLNTQVILVENQNALRQAVERRDKPALLQILLPLKAVLDFDWMKVVDREGNVLVEVRKDALNQAKVLDATISDSARRGAGFTNLVRVEVEHRQKVLLAASQPVKTEKLLGGLVVGRLVNHDLLQKIAAGSSKEMLALIGNQVIAATLPDVYSLDLPISRLQDRVERIVLGNQQYLAKSFVLSSSNASFSTIVLYPISVLEGAKRSLWLRLGLLLVIGSTIVTLIGIFVSKAIARPILRLTRMTQFLAQGDTTVRVPITSQDEVSQLSKAFNQMAEQLAERGLLSQTIQHLQQSLQDLEKNQAQLIHTEKMSSLGHLVAGIAHEINTPLGAIRSSISNVTHALGKALEELPPLIRTLPPEHLSNFFTLLDWARQPKEPLSSREERQLKRALHQALVNHGVPQADVLAEMLSRMGITITLEPILPLLQSVDAPTILDTACQLSIIQNNSQNIQIAVDRAAKIVYALKSYVRQDVLGVLVYASVADGIDTVLTLYQNQIKSGIEVTKNYATVPSLLCHPDELIQVWSNLISNAIHAMDNRGELGIAIAEQDQNIVVQISDSGKGIPEEVKTRIFEPFFTTKPSGEGTGLGLSIVNKILKKHHGRIEVESISGHTIFRVWLPLNISQSGD